MFGAVLHRPCEGGGLMALLELSGDQWAVVYDAIGQYVENGEDDSCGLSARDLRLLAAAKELRVQMDATLANLVRP